MNNLTPLLVGLIFCDKLRRARQSLGGLSYDDNEIEELFYKTADLRMFVKLYF